MVWSLLGSNNPSAVVFLSIFQNILRNDMVAVLWHHDDIIIPVSFKTQKKTRILQVSQERTGLGFKIAA